MEERFGEFAAQLHAAEAEHGDVVVEVEAGGVLTGVSHAGLALERFEGADIDKIGGPIALGIAAEVYFIEVEGEGFAEGGPGAQRQCGTSAMVEMSVDRPLGKDNIRLERRQKLRELRISGGSYFSRAVHLRGKEGAGF